MVFQFRGVFFLIGNRLTRNDKKVVFILKKTEYIPSSLYSEVVKSYIETVNT